MCSIAGNLWNLPAQTLANFQRTFNFTMSFGMASVFCVCHAQQRSREHDAWHGLHCKPTNCHHTVAAWSTGTMLIPRQLGCAALDAVAVKPARGQPRLQACSACALTACALQHISDVGKCVSFPVRPFASLFKDPVDGDKWTHWGLSPGPSLFKGPVEGNKWTHWGLSPGPSACGADVIPLHHVPLGHVAISTTHISNQKT